MTIVETPTVEDGSPAETTTRRRRWPRVAMVGVAAFGAGALLVSQRGGSGETHSLTGSFVLYDEPIVEVSGMGCLGSGGYSDISASTDVVIKNATGKILGVAELGRGDLGGVTELWDGTRYGTSCSYEWSSPPLQKEDFYVVSVGRRGDMTFSYEDMVAAGWSMASSLGR